MNDKPASSTHKPVRPGRDERLKAALKANMSRRKAQARARSESRSEDGETKTNEKQAED